MPRSSPIWGRDGGLTGRRDGGSGDSPTERSERVSEDVARIHDGDVIDESFDELMGMLDHPVFVVTTQADGHPAGCLVSFATQTSVQPRVLWSACRGAPAPPRWRADPSTSPCTCFRSGSMCSPNCSAAKRRRRGQQVRPLLVARWPLWNADSRRRGRLVHR